MNSNQLTFKIISVTDSALPILNILHCIHVLLLLFSYPVVSNFLWPHRLQHARPPCPSPSPGVCPSSCQLHWGCRPANSSSDALPSFHLILWCPLLLLPSIFPSTGDFSNESSVRIRWPKYWSFSFSIRPSSEIQGWSPLMLNKYLLNQSVNEFSKS